MISVLIADDQALVRTGLRLILDAEADLQVVGEAGDGRDAIRQSRITRPDVVLMDVRMPVLNGIDATRELLSTGDAPRVIVLTMFDLDQYVYDALQAGASGFMLKNAPPAALIHAVRVAHEGNALLAPEVTRRLISHLAPTPRTDDPRIRHLTARERETLALIGKGRSNDEIADELFVTRTTVRTYVSRILTKTGARDRAQLVVIAYECALVPRVPGLSTPAD